MIAVSGGVDSRFLIHAAWSWGLDFQAVHATGPHQSDKGRRQALAWLKTLKAGPTQVTQVIDFDPLELPEVQNNSAQRCYLCKLAMFSRFRDLATTRSYSAILDGSQIDDARAFRPGRQALQELGVHSPLAVVGLNKAQVRLSAERLGLSEPDQPARPCLLTRFPYDRKISRQGLAAVGQAEDCLSTLGLRQFRFRVLADNTFLLQIHFSERLVWQAVKPQAGPYIAGLGLEPFDVLETERLSGFFDVTTHHNRLIIG
jgi:uncharacterized protein